ncbi:MAG: GldG family protein [Dehalococcoidia bacterium]
MRFISNIDEKLAEDIGLALGAAGLIALIAGGVIYGVIPEIRTWALALMFLGVVSLAGFAFLARDLIASFFQTRQGRYGINTAGLIIIFTLSVVILNFFSSNWNFRVDLTATDQFTLAPQTKQALSNLSEDVEAYGFFVPEDPGAITAERLMNEYVLETEKLSYTMVDPETDPSQAKRYQVDRSGLIVFAGASGQVSRTNNISEQSLTASLLRATGENLKTVCFTTGHGERSILGSTDLGLRLAAQALERELYIVRDFSFSSSDGVPEECSAIIVVGPERDLIVDDKVDEEARIREYLGRGGNAFFLLTPTTPSSWTNLLLEGGVETGGGTIVDPSSYAQPDRTTPQIRVEGYLPGHPITDPLIEQSLVTFFPLTTRVAPLPESQRTPGASIVPLIFTSDRSWLETDSSSLDNATYDQLADISRGQNAIATAVQFPAANEIGQQITGRIFVIGNSAFAGNLFFHSLGNGDLFINTVNWLTTKEDLISIRPKLSSARLLILSQREADWLLYSSVGLLPLMSALMGFWVWWRRR